MITFKTFLSCSFDRNCVPCWNLQRRKRLLGPGAATAQLAAQLAARSRTSSVTPAAPALQRSARPRQRHGSTWWHTAADDRVDQKDDNHDIPTMITWNNHDNMELQYVFSFQLSFWKRWITFSVTVGKETFPGDFQSPFAKGQTSMCTAAPPPKASQENYNNIQQSNKYMKKCPTLWRISILY